MSRLQVDGFDRGEAREIRSGAVKWFDAKKGFGFIVSEDGGADIMVHAACVRESGFLPLQDGDLVEVIAVRRPRGLYAQSLLRIDRDSGPQGAAICDRETAAAPSLPCEQVASPMLPARVRWFDEARGYGFVQVFGRSEDIFVHRETLRASGLEDLASGQAIAARVGRRPSGLVALEIRPW